eukprot:1177412-Prorocentrum_minimum.AAC.1
MGRDIGRVNDIGRRGRKGGGGIAMRAKEERLIEGREHKGREVSHSSQRRRQGSTRTYDIRLNGQFCGVRVASPSSRREGFVSQSLGRGRYGRGDAVVEPNPASSTGSKAFKDMSTADKHKVCEDNDAFYDTTHLL